MSHPTNPVQERSRDSFVRLVKSAEALISEKGFAQTSLREICAKAGLTSGAFYARFDQKEDLAFPMLENLFAEMTDLAEGFDDDIGRLGLDSAMSRFLSSVVGYYRSKGGILRALIEVGRSNPEVLEELQRFNREFFAKLIGGIQRHKIKIPHPDPSLALQLGFLCVLNALREIVLNQHLVDQPYGFEDAALVNELTQMFHRYLRMP